MSPCVPLPNGRAPLRRAARAPTALRTCDAARRRPPTAPRAPVRHAPSGPPALRPPSPSTTARQPLNPLSRRAAPHGMRAAPRALAIGHVAGDVAPPAPPPRTRLRDTFRAAPCRARRRKDFPRSIHTRTPRSPIDEQGFVYPLVGRQLLQITVPAALRYRSASSSLRVTGGGARRRRPPLRCAAQAVSVPSGYARHVRSGAIHRARRPTSGRLQSRTPLP